MVAMTPLVINFLIRSMGLLPTICARSRITMLAGNSILFPFVVLIGPPPQISNSMSKVYCGFLLSLCARSHEFKLHVTWLLAHPRSLNTRAIFRFLRQGVHKFFQFCTFIWSQSRL